MDCDNSCVKLQDGYEPHVTFVPIQLTGNISVCYFIIHALPM